MAWAKVLFRSIAEAICAQGLRGLLGAVPFGDVFYEVADNAWDRFRKYQDQAEDRAMLEGVVRASMAEIKEEARAVVTEVCAQQPEEVRTQVIHYLTQVPSLIRQSFKRPSDAQGLSFPLLLSLQKSADLLAFLPARLPRFQAGDRPPGVGDWELVELLGVGGFGEVWKARHRFFDGIAPVALKFCLDPTARDRLLRYEANVLNQVMRHGRHPGIVALLDAFLGSDPPCLKYEYVEGGDLTGLLREWQPLTVSQRWQPATRVMARLAGIVGTAHRLSPAIVHRDLKPANILLEPLATGNWQLKVTDFGIGSVAALPAIAAARQGTTTRGQMLATALRGAHTPLYASPQQMRGDPPDVRDDVHALGVIWYQLLTGDLGSGAPTGLWSEELEEAGLDRAVIRLLGTCVAAKPERRPADAAVLAEQLNALLDPPPPVLVSTAPRLREDDRQALLTSLEANPYSWLLDLTNKQIGDRGVVLLADLSSLSRRTALILSGNQLGNEGAAALAASPHVANLDRLILWDNHIGDEGVTALAQSPYLANLTTLDLGRNRVGDAGVSALASSPHMANLNALILVSNQVGDAGAAALAASPYLAHLAELKPLNNRISAAGVTALRERFGKRVRIY